MATPPTLFDSDYTSTTGTAASRQMTVDIEAGMVIVVGATGDDGTSYPAGAVTNDGAALTWTQRGLASGSSNSNAAQWTAVGDSTRTLTITVTPSGSEAWYCYARVWSGTQGVGASASVAGDTSAPYEITVPGCNVNSVIDMAWGDWSPVAGSRTYITSGAGTFTEQGANLSPGAAYVANNGYYADAGAAGSKAVGTSAPTGQDCSIVAVEIMAADAPAPPATEVGWGTAVAGTTSITTVAYPSGWAVGDLLVCAVASNSTTEANQPTVAGFDLIDTLNGGGGSQGAGVGNRRLSYFTRVAQPGDDTIPTVSLTSGNVMIAAIGAFRTGTGHEWASPSAVAAFGAETTAGTGWTEAMTTDPGLAAGDLLVLSCAVRDTSASTAEGITATGATFTPGTERIDLSSETGNDIALHVATCSVVTGPASAAPTRTATHSTSETGVMGVLRVRAVETSGGPAEGTATGTLAFSGSATGKRTPTATGGGTLAFTGSATGKRVPKASGSGSLTYTGSATGQRRPEATASGSLAYAGTATGVRTPRGTASGMVAFSGSATGKRVAKGAATGSLVYEGAAVGESPGIPPATGTAGGTLTYEGTAVGKRIPKGSGGGTLAYEGTAAGVRRPVGSAGGTLAFVGSAAGTTDREGAAIGTLAYVGTATGRRTPKGSAGGTLTYAGSASGIQPGPGGIATGSLEYHGTAVGAMEPLGQSGGTLTYVGAAEGYRAPVAAAEGSLTYHGVAIGYRPGGSTGVAVGWLTYTGAAVGVQPVTRALTAGEALPSPYSSGPHSPTLSAAPAEPAARSVGSAHPGRLTVEEARPDQLQVSR
jgi:hypothetical protein